MKSIISLHIGAPGIRIGSQLWDLLDSETRTDSDWHSRAFREDAHGQKQPNAIFVDTDPDLKNEVKKNEALSAIPFIAGGESAMGVAMYAHYVNGKEVMDTTLDTIRKTMEECESVGGFALFYSLSGGNGSGLTALLLDRLEVMSVEPRISFMILPDGNSVVEPYNFVLGINTVHEKTGLIVNYDNATTGKAATHLGLTASISDANSVIAQTASHLFAQKDDFSDSFAGLSAISSELKFAFPSVSLNLPSDFSIETDACAMSESVLKGRCFDFDPSKTVKSYTQFRGNWSRLSAETYMGTTPPNHFDLYSSPRPEWRSWTSQHQSVMTLTWSTSIMRTFRDITKQFDRMYSKRAFVHWYVGIGVSEGEFSQVREDFEILKTRLAA